MPDRTPPDLLPDPLEAELVALGRALVVDAPPADLADRVIGRLVQAGPAPAVVAPAPPRGLRRWTLAAAVAALLVVVLVPPVRAAVLDLFRIGGVTVREAPTPPDGSAPRTPSGGAGSGATSSGAVVVGSLAEASARVGFEVTAPAGLGAPTTVAVARDGRVVELTWGTGAGSTRLDVFDGTLSSGYLKTVWEDVTPTDVGGAEAVWFAAPHLVEWTDRAGQTVSSPPRVAGPTLVWVGRDARGRELTHRLEGPGTLEEARALAEALP